MTDTIHDESGIAIGEAAAQVPGPDLPAAVRAIWTVLHAYQDEMIPFEKYQELADDYRENAATDFDKARGESAQQTADEYREEWDDICLHMAHIIEALGLTQEECS